MGENMVARFLRKNGCTLIKRNFQTRFGEIDMIAETQEYILFVEVKIREEDTVVPIEEVVDARKRKRMLLAAERFLTLYHTELCPRFDVALVTAQPGEDGSETYRLRYIKNAF